MANINSKGVSLLNAWKNGYKECKKCKSKIVKDEYDTRFFDIIRFNYKTSLKGKNKVTYDDLMKFFLSVVQSADYWFKIPDKKRRKSFYYSKRVAAVATIRKASNDIIKGLENDEILNDELNIPDTADKVKSGYTLNCFPIAFDVPTSSKLLNNIRIYLCLIFPSGILSRNFHRAFDFSNYTDAVSGKEIRDTKISERRIYKIHETYFNIVAPRIATNGVGDAVISIVNGVYKIIQSVWRKLKGGKGDDKATAVAVEANVIPADLTKIAGNVDVKVFASSSVGRGLDALKRFIDVGHEMQLIAPGDLNGV